MERSGFISFPRSALVRRQRQRQAGEQFQLRRRFERLLLRVEQAFDGFEVLLLQLDVGGNRHCAEPVMAVGHFRRFLEVLHGIGPPLGHLAQLRFVSQRGFDDLALHLALGDVERNLRLHLARVGGFDVARVPIPQRQRQRDADADDALAVAGVFLGEGRADGRWPGNARSWRGPRGSPAARVRRRARATRSCSCAPAPAACLLSSGGRNARCVWLDGQARVRRDAAKLIQLQQRRLRGERRFARLALRVQLGRLDDARFEQAASARPGSRCTSTSRKRLEPLGHFRRRGGLFLRGEQTVSQRPHAPGERDFESLVAKFGQFDVAIRNGLAQSDASRPLERLHHRHRPRHALGGQPAAAHGLLARRCRSIRDWPSRPGGLASGLRGGDFGLVELEFRILLQRLGHERVERYVIGVLGASQWRPCAGPGRGQEQRPTEIPSLHKQIKTDKSDTENHRGVWTHRTCNSSPRGRRFT